MRPYSRRVFGADTGLGAFDPASLVLDMGPNAGTRIDPHAFASGHQYGAAIGMRGLGQQFLLMSRRSGRLGAIMPPVMDPGASPIAQLTQSFVYDPSGAPVAQVTRDQTVAVPSTVAAAVVPALAANVVPASPVPGTSAPMTIPTPGVVGVSSGFYAQNSALKYSLVGVFLGTAATMAIAWRSHGRVNKSLGAALVLPILGVAAGQWLALRKV